MSIKTLALAAALFGQLAAAHAGELTLFSRDNFRGEEVTIRDGSRDLREAGFNDRASSLVVHSGVWEVCEHKDFGGYCAVFERGEYNDLRRFNNSISSLRQVERGGRGGGAGGFRDRDRDGVDDRVERREERMERRDDRRDERGGGYGQNRPDPIELFEHAGLGGRRVSVQGETRSLSGLGFNDRASSMIINEGQWQLCEHDNFGGRCVIYGPGRYDNLGPMNDQASSLRRIR
ncbi:beta/gamma crystallin family protein [Pseudoduganella sp. LjRoot289]|uniref:beta/gamma crystallin family protein n=1 Tax=Pseudoduganella sp. LjRoot289 TaxID=3342314 RepID=UPI003ECD77C2